MIILYIKWTDDTEMYRTVHRVDINKAGGQLYIWDTPEQTVPEQIKSARVQIFVNGTNMRTYMI